MIEMSKRLQQHLQPAMHCSRSGFIPIMRSPGLLLLAANKSWSPPSHWLLTKNSMRVYGKATEDASLRGSFRPRMQGLMMLSQLTTEELEKHACASFVTNTLCYIPNVNKEILDNVPQSLSLFQETSFREGSHCFYQFSLGIDILCRIIYHSHSSYL